MCLVDGRAGKTLLAPVLRAPPHPLSLCEASMPWRRGPATRGRLQGPSLQLGVRSSPPGGSPRSAVGERSGHGQGFSAGP